MNRLHLPSFLLFSKTALKILTLIVLVISSGHAFCQTDASEKSSVSPAGIQSFLPGTLINWTATVDKNKVLLTWTTTVEKNSRHFTVEKSFDGLEFSEAALLFAAGNSDMRKQYVFSEKLSINANKAIYYRLKMVDMDANVKYSDVRTVRSNKLEGVKLELFPNPAINDLKVTVTSSWVNQKLIIQLCNINGVLVKSKVNEKAKETETIDIKDLPGGMYIVRVLNGNESSSQQFLKN
jgi:hypothetical protein